MLKTLLLYYSNSMEKIKILSVGGSIVAPDAPDVAFIKSFHEAVTEYLAEDDQCQLVCIIGGGGPARQYQKAYRDITSGRGNAVQQDWIGIMATRLNAELLKGTFGNYCSEPVVTDPTSVTSFKGRILFAAGWKPGFSTDNDSVLLAENLGAFTVINLSNIAHVYSADPKKDPSAVPLESLTWTEMIKLVGDTWIPGRNVPFDPIATRKAAELGLTVITAEGRDIPNLKRILRDQSFRGTTIKPEQP